MHSANDLVICLDDYNVDVNRHIDGLDEILEGMVYVRGICRKNVIGVLP